MMLGYTADSGIQRTSGRFDTGDLGRLLPDGCLSLAGRRRDIINVGGQKVDPSEVERVLMCCPGVTDCAVYGGKDTHGQEIALAAVVTEDSGLREDHVRQKCMEMLARYKVPRRVFPVTHIPRTPTGKCLRAQLPFYGCVPH
jgi:acyl-CoA synthetase (AMP-forming)/AMP-acid ligase II